MADKNDNLIKKYETDIKAAKNPTELADIIGKLNDEITLSSSDKMQLTSLAKARSEKLYEEDKVAQTIKYETNIAKEKEQELSKEAERKAEVKAIYEKFNNVHKEALETQKEYNKHLDSILDAVAKGEDIPEKTKEEMKRLEVLHREHWLHVEEAEKAAKEEHAAATASIAAIDRELKALGHKDQERQNLLLAQRKEQVARQQEAKGQLDQVKEQHEQRDLRAEKLVDRLKLAEQNKDKNLKNHKFLLEREQKFKEMHGISAVEALENRKKAQQQEMSGMIKRMDLFRNKTPHNFNPHTRGTLIPKVGKAVPKKDKIQDRGII